MKKYRKLKDKKLYRKNHESLKKGFKRNGIYIKTWDYEFEDKLDIKIKDFHRECLNKMDDPEHVKYHIETKLYKDIYSADVLYGDWWRIGNEKEMFYLIVSHPMLIAINKYEIKSLINSHYHEIYGYSDEFYKPMKFKRIKGDKRGLYKLEKDERIIKDTGDLIDEYLDKDSEIYKYYENIIKENNERALKINEVLISRGEYDYKVLNVIVPFNSDLTHQELFENILKRKYKIVNYDEDKVLMDSLDCSTKMKDFLYKFKPIVKEIVSIKRKKR